MGGADDDAFGTPAVVVGGPTSLEAFVSSVVTGRVADVAVPTADEDLDELFARLRVAFQPHLPAAPEVEAEGGDHDESDDDLSGLTAVVAGMAVVARAE